MYLVVSLSPSFFLILLHSSPACSRKENRNDRDKYVKYILTPPLESCSVLGNSVVASPENTFK